MNIEDFIDQSNGAVSVDQLFNLFERAMADLGLDRVIFSLMTDHIALRKDAVHGLVRNYPEHWMDYYTSVGYEDVDPVRSMMFCASTPFLWKDIVESEDLSKNQMTVMLEGEESGLHAGIGIPLRANRGALAGVGAASTDIHLQLNKNQISQVNLLSYQFYTCYQVLMASQPELSDIELSNREKDVLKWTAIGKRKHEIGDIMCLSKHTIDYHTSHILQKLDSNSMIAAVAKAINQGIIQI